MDNFFKNIGGKGGKKTGGSRGGGQKLGGGGGSSGGGPNNSKSNNHARKNDDGPKPLQKMQEHLSTLGNNMKQANANVVRKQPATKGPGQTLGGSKPGTYHTITFSESGSIGVKVEKTEGGGCIVANVIPGGQAEKAGMKRGDIVCLASDDGGGEEMSFQMFLDLAAGTDRPIVVSVRRVQLKKGGGGGVSSGAGGNAVETRSAAGSQGGASASAEARRQAVIAAAEERERKHREKTRPKTAAERYRAAHAKNNNGSSATSDASSEGGPMSEETKRAVDAAKQAEAATAASLGYNPYEVKKMGHGQAKVAVTTTTHGTMNDTLRSNIPQEGGGDAPLAAAPIAVQSPPPLSAHEQIDEAFDEAFVILATSQSATPTTVKTLRTLVNNATTKGQKSEEEGGGEKFRRVRLSNPKIQKAIVDVSGALDMMMSCGFTPHEDATDGETYLIYPVDRTPPDWIPLAIRRMEDYEKTLAS